MNIAIFTLLKVSLEMKKTIFILIEMQDNVKKGRRTTQI